VLRGPLKIFDTTPALIGGLFAQKHGKFVEYSHIVYEAFFKRELAADEVEAIVGVLTGLGLNEAEFRTFLEGEGKAQYERIQEESTADEIFGVPIMRLSGENFWGYDRIGLLETRLKEKRLER
jgi:2-hydroxychromene-2-carboxylate isomerase